MIPEHDPAPRPPLTLEFVFLLALVAPLCQFIWMLVFDKLGFHLEPSARGMGTLVTYGAMFALCAARLRVAPARHLGFVAAPLSAWLSVVFLAPWIVVTSEVDNLMKAAFAVPLPEQLAVEIPRYFIPMSAVLAVAVFPLAYDVFFRGMLQPLASARFGAVAGVALAAVLSGFASGFLAALVTNVWQFPRYLLDALVLCILRQCGSSLWPVLALDMLWGVANVCGSYELFGLAGFDGGGAHTPMRWVAGAGALAAVGFALCRAAARSERPAQV